MGKRGKALTQELRGTIQRKTWSDRLRGCQCLGESEFMSCWFHLTKFVATLSRYSYGRNGQS
jgi:hypothetical protein